MTHPVTVEEMIHQGMVYGLPFPEIYDLTWGEIAEFIQCKNEARKYALRDQATMDFRAATVLVHMMTAQKGQKFNLMDEYDFLWSDEERAEARRREIESRFRVAKS